MRKELINPDLMDKPIAELVEIFQGLFGKFVSQDVALILFVQTGKEKWEMLRAEINRINNN